MGGKNDPPPPPDYSGLIAMNEKTAKLGLKLARDQFNWSKSVYNENKGLMKATSKSFLDTMEFGRKAAAEDRARYKAQYQPMEDKLLADARTYDTPERRDMEVGAAQANVAQAFEAARDSATKQLESFGVNPSATRFAGLDLGLRTQKAAAQAAAGTSASRSVEDKGRALKAAAVDVGRGYPGSYLAAAQLGNQSAGGAVNAANQTFGTGAQAMGTGPEWLGGANAAQGNWGNVLNNQYSNQLSGWQAGQNQSSGWGSILGLGAGLGMKAFGFEEGGAVPAELSPSGGAEQDDVPVAVTVGEFVIPKDAVQWHGEKHFHKLIEKAREERQQAVPA